MGKTEDRLMQARDDGLAWVKLIEAVPKDGLGPDETYTVEATWDPLDVPPDTIVVYVEGPDGDPVASGFATTLDEACTQARVQLEAYVEKESAAEQQAIEAAEMLDGFPDDVPLDDRGDADGPTL